MTIRKHMLAGVALLIAVGMPGRAVADQGGRITIIRGGDIYDGSSAAPIKGDVVIQGDRIVHVGPGARTFVHAEVIDARGMIVAPGFIDPHTHAQRFLDSEGGGGRLNLPWLMQGVTTIFTGVDGGGSPDVRATLDDVEKRTFGTNVATYVGFGPVRRAVIGDDARAPTAAELDKMKALVATGMCEGSIGLSTGLFYAPQSFSKTEEVVALAREAAKRGGIYDSHQRDESSYTVGLARSVEEAISIGRAAGLPVHIAHIKALGVDVHGKAPDIIAMIDKARGQGQRITADQYPWDASGTSLQAALLPGWAVDGGRDAMLRRLDDAVDRPRIESAMAENMRRRGGAHSLLLTVPEREWTGLRLDEIAARWSVSPIAAAIRIIRHDDHSGKLVSFNMADKDIVAFMRQPWVFTGSDGSEGHPRMYATFPRKFAKYVLEDRVIDTAGFINSSTGRTADMFGLRDRGHLRVGYKADVVILDPASYRPVATYLAPRELATGVHTLFVNGRQAIAAGKPTGIAAGKAIRHAPPAGTCQR